jgi:hypothetical protein
MTRTNQLDASNIQTKHIASTLCAFLAAAVPLNVAKTFKLSGICLVTDEDALRCTFPPDRAKRLLALFLSTFPDLLDSGSDDPDREELQMFVEEYFGLLYDFEAEAPESKHS